MDNFCYIDNYRFTEKKVIEIQQFCVQNGIIYAQIFGSYLENKDTGYYRDIDIGIYCLDEDRATLYTEDIEIAFEKILGFKVDITPFNWCDNVFSYQVLDNRSIIWWSPFDDSKICNNIENVHDWYDKYGEAEERNRYNSLFGNRRALNEIEV